MKLSGNFLEYLARTKVRFLTEYFKHAVTAVGARNFW